MLVTELLDGKRFEEVKALSAAERDRFGEIVFRFFFGTLNHLGRASGDPHPGNYLWLEGGRVGFLDFGLMRVVDPAYLAGEQAIARAAAAGDAAAVHRGMAALGYLPSPGDFDPARLLEQLRVGAEWYFEPGERRITPAYVSGLMERGGEFLDDLRRMTLPPQALLIRRMEGLVFQTLGEVRASADWAAIGAEYHAGDAPVHASSARSTPSSGATAGRSPAPPELSLSRRARRRPRSQRGSGTGSSIESVKTSCCAPRSSRFGRSSGSSMSCHGGLARAGGGGGGGCFLNFIESRLFSPVSVKARSRRDLACADVPAIGVMREGPLHAAVKALLAEPGDRLEVPVGRFVIDLVRADGELVEVQTGGFGALGRKLDALLDEHRVRIVHPIAAERRIVRVDEHGEVVGSRRSPKPATAVAVFDKLVAFPSLLATRT